MCREPVVHGVSLAVDVDQDGEADQVAAEGGLAQLDARRVAGDGRVGRVELEESIVQRLRDVELGGSGRGRDAGAGDVDDPVRTP